MRHDYTPENPGPAWVAVIAAGATAGVLLLPFVWVVCTVVKAVWG